ncbi:hypothetical protein [Nonomuraea longicatena]|uniref:hypothetical protein n=1 Tax=Nonomuraea longicatena TaxID=83682 RepID=UPI003CD071B6
MDHWDADVVMFQEMCHGQWTFLRDLLQGRPSGPKYDSVWGASLPSARGCGKWGGDSDRFGLAIFVAAAPASSRKSTRTTSRTSAQPAARRPRTAAVAARRPRSLPARLTRTRPGRSTTSS